MEGSIVVSGSVVSFNSTRDDFASGGGIAVENHHTTSSPDNSVVIENSIISNNSTIGTLAHGGGLFVNEDGIREVLLVRVSGSTISENTASRGVAGVYLNGVIATIADSTISSNRWVPRSGTLPESYVRGGIFLDAGDLALVRSTVTKNSGRSSGNGIHSSSSGEVHLDHSIVAGNINLGALAIPVDIAAGGVITARSSLIGAAVGITDGGGNFIGTPQSPINPLLGPLVYNGGPVFLDGSAMLTHALLPGSPAIDAEVLVIADPIALYRFEETTGPIAADSVNDNDGTYHGDLTLGQASALPLLGNAAQFDGVDDFVVIPRTVSDDLSFSLWVKMSQSAAGTLVGGDVSGNSKDFELSVGSGRLVFRVGGQDSVSDSLVRINDDIWHHVAVTRDAATNTRKLYIDGFQSGTDWTNGMTGPMTAASELHIGELLSGLNRFEGLIDELAIYDRVLTGAEVHQLATPTFPSFDQRGAPWSRVVDGRIDIGAVESQPNPLPGDYNFNGVVDAADYVVWRKTVGSTNDPRADGSGNGIVDQADYDFWRANFGNTMGAGSGAVAEDPHPLDYSRPLPDGEVSRVARLELPAMGVAVASTRRENHALRLGLRDVPPAARQDALLTAWLKSHPNAGQRDEHDSSSPAADHNAANDSDELAVAALDQAFAALDNVLLSLRERVNH
jgi:hypothetical protein